MIPFTTAVACAWVTVAAAAGTSDDEGEIGYGEEITYLAPDEVRALPPRVRSKLKQMGCLIPRKSWEGHRNVIQGSFARKDQRDWAVVCSVEGKFHIHLFWGGTASCEPRIPLRGWLPIERVGKRYIWQMYENFGEPKPPPITHDGLDAIFVGKAASVIYYCHEGKWLELNGSD